MSLPYSFDFPRQLKNRLRVQGVAPKLHFGHQILLCSTRSQPQNCQNLLNLHLLLDATGLTAAFPSTRQGQCVEKTRSTTPRMRCQNCRSKNRPPSGQNCGHRAPNAHRADNKRSVDLLLHAPGFGSISKQTCQNVAARTRGC